MLKQFTSHRRHSAIFAQKRIGIRAMRKYTFASSANGSLYTMRRLITSGCPRRTRSETELIFSESTNLVAALLRAFGMRRPKDSFPAEIPCGEVMMFIRPDILIRFGVIVLGDRMNWSMIGTPGQLIVTDKTIYTSR